MSLDELASVRGRPQPYTSKKFSVRRAEMADPPDASSLPMPKTFAAPSPFLAPANAGPAARRKGSVVSGHDGQSEVPTLVMRDAAQGLKREAVRLVRQDSGLPDALKKLRASRQLEMALASAGDEQARDSLIEQSQRVSSRVLLAIERTASDECIAAVGATELDAGDLVDETLLEVYPPAPAYLPTTCLPA